jgi:hypothetical protein
MNNDEKYSLDIRGRSRNRQGNGKLIRNELSTSRRKRSSSLKYNSKSLDYSEPLHDIPENVETIYGQDRDKVRLPIFGKTKNGLFFHLTKSGISGRRSESSTSSSIDNQKERETPRTSKIVLDELETILREKVRSQLHDVRAKFRHAAQNDPNGKINRQALQHLIATIFGTQKQIGPNQIDKLLERINLKYANKISFDEFLQSLFNGEDDIPDWVSHPPSPRNQSSAKKSATQMFVLLKDKIRTR